MVYKVGDKIGKYILTRTFTTQNAGRCQWGFVSCKEQEYFIKKFDSPVYPGKEAPGSEKSKKKKRERCKVFEARYTAIKNALSHFGEGGLIVQPIDFFRYGNKSEEYFKIFHKIDTNLLAKDIHALHLKERLSIMTSAAYSVSELHKKNIIHFDLKPDNILVEKAWGTSAKLIDFDDSIIAGGKIEPDEIVGDFVYYSPELARYIETEGETEIPDFKSDVFALGLIFSKYWTGKLPNFSSDFTYPYQAILAGNRLKISKGKVRKSRIQTSRNLRGSKKLSPEDLVVELIEYMLSFSRTKRPTAKEVHENLKTIIERL
ncbi:serine/threonine protein kinase [[Leptolyngbya] sp. PCC 7376]|uniref:protein kinase domain-containing protein n=1 Tax=[Leptolyngbya] sp. PCC 7376 TaxID=111781 RepID=UPI00029F416C|nr:protein kinase [[Leptolyngbya] sp. PCC 7376]AFY38206.1 serine/threonine protein kinase [[Leptolyngbya] sp. PCC 7376]